MEIPVNEFNEGTPQPEETLQAEGGIAEAPVDPLTAALAEAEKWKDLAYRNAAELDNFRKRMAREGQESRAYANASLLQDLFPVLDNFEMGMDAARLESEKSMIYMGMSMVQRQLHEFLKDNNVAELLPVGLVFDPKQHDAVSQEASTDVPEGTIIRVMRRGYQLKERLLRPATVVVSSGPAAESNSSAS